MSCKFFGEGNWSQSQAGPGFGGGREKGEWEIDVAL